MITLIGKRLHRLLEDYTDWEMITLIAEDYTDGELITPIVGDYIDYWMITQMGK